MKQKMIQSTYQLCSFDINTNEYQDKETIVKFGRCCRKKGYEMNYFQGIARQKRWRAYTGGVWERSWIQKASRHHLSASLGSSTRQMGVDALQVLSPSQSLCLYVCMYTYIRPKRAKCTYLRGITRNTPRNFENSQNTPRKHHLSVSLCLMGVDVILFFYHNQLTLVVSC